MEILRRLVDSREGIVGLRLKDTDGYEFYIKITSLYNPEILNSLKESGWELHGLPHDIRNNGMSLESIPAIEYASISFTPEEIQEMEDFDVVRMTEKEIRALLKPSEEGHKFREGNYIIHTREELESFLRGVLPKLSKKSEADDFSIYVPLNTFVAPSARYTIPEYFSAENAEFRSIIEKRRSLSFINFKKLQDFLIELGMPRDFDSKGLLDFYFSWGICGMNLNVNSVTETREQRALTGLAADVGDTKVYAFTTGYITPEGNTYSDLDVKVSYTKGEYSKTKILGKLMEAGSSSKDIVPVEVRYPIHEKRTLMIGPDLSLEYSMSVMRIHYKTSRYFMHTLIVQNPINPRLRFKYSCWNLTNDGEILEELRAHLICKQIQESVRVVTDASSMKVLMSMGVSPMNAFNYIFNNIDLDSAFVENEDEEGQVLTFDPKQLISEYLMDMLDENDPQYSNVSDFVYSVLEGIINVDAIETGTQLDDMFDDNLIHVVQGARRYLGLSWAQIEEAASLISTENNELILESADKRIRHLVVPKDNKDRAYSADVQAYTKRRAETVLYVTRVVNVMTEPFCDGYEPRHCAVQLEVIPIENKKQGSTGTTSNKYMEGLLKDLTRLTKNKLLELAPARASDLGDLCETWVIHSLFDIAYTGTIRALVPLLGDDAVINVPKEYREFMKARIYTRCDSLTALCDNVLDRSGKFILVNVNAIITPNFVIPLKDVTLPTVPFRFYFSNTAHFPPDVKADYVSRGWLPNMNHHGFIFTYDSNRIIPAYKQVVDKNSREGFAMVKTTGDLVQLVEAIESNLEAYKTTLSQYAEEGRLDEAPNFMMWPDPYSESYPLFTEFYSTDIRYKEDELSKDPCYNTGKPGTITREDVIRRSDYVRNIVTSNTLSLTSSAATIEPGVVYEYDDIRDVESVEQTKLYDSFDDDRIKAVAVANRKNIIFTDRTMATPEDILTLDREKYAIEKVSDKMFILADIHGARFTVRKK